MIQSSLIVNIYIYISKPKMFLEVFEHESCPVSFVFILFQTTKGASAFKICRGVEAVGGNLRSVISQKCFT